MSSQLTVIVLKANQGKQATFVSREVSAYAVEIIETKRDYIFWLKILKQYTKLDQDIVSGIVYVPSAQSSF